MTNLARREHFARVRAVFEDLVELEPSVRDAQLSNLERTDTQLARELRALLAAARDAPAFLETSAQATALEGRVVGAWRIEERIASGGMGDVYRASRVGDDVPWQAAVKVLRAGFDGAAMLAHFRHERRTLATLNHPNIVSLVDVGTLEDGRPYFVMELVVGQPIDRYCAEQGLDLRARLALFGAVCSAVEHAHRSLIAHCDLKPANVLVTRSGHVKLLDFGIAEILNATGAPRALPITPGYASPEQVRGEPITVASDVWSLGVLLYELVTGAHPFRGRERTGLKRGARSAEIVPELPSRAASADTAGRRWARSVRGDLDAVILRCLTTDPSLRCASVAELDSDVRAFLDTRPVAARPLSLPERWVRVIVRNPWTAFAIAAALLSLALAATLSVREARRMRAEAGMGWRAHAQAVQVTRLLETLLLEARHDASLEATLDSAAARAEATLADEPETLGRLHIAFGALYLDWNRPEKARVQLERALALVRAQRGFGREDVERAEELLARARAQLPN